MTLLSLVLDWSKGGDAAVEVEVDRACCSNPKYNLTPDTTTARWTFALSCKTCGAVSKCEWRDTPWNLRIRAKIEELLR